MNDPHVESLTYRVTKADDVDFDKALPLTMDKGVFQVTIDAYTATVAMRDHFATAEEARAVVEPFLRAWEFVEDLNHQSRFRFGYVQAQVIDRKPPPNGSAVHHAGVGLAAVAGLAPTVHIGRSKWPDPPEGLAVSPDAEIMRRCWLRRHEWPMAAAYLALTVLEASAQMALGASRKKKRQAARDYYNIEEDVLEAFGCLTDKRGGDGARKAEGLYAPLSPGERKWVEGAFKALVLRAAERAYHGRPPPRQLTMADLPKL